MVDEIQTIAEWLRDWGSAGAVIIVVILFLRHLKDRDSEFNSVLRDLTRAIHEWRNMK